jgi:O-antigen/teichoic acid export membrane protein
MEVINRVSLPVLSRMRTDQNGLRNMHVRLLGLVAAYAFGTCWGLAAVAPEFVAFVLGDKWQTAALPLMFLAAIAPLRMLSALNNTVAAAAGVPQASTFELAFAGLLVPTALLAGAWFNGLHGACQAWVVAYPVVYIASNALTCGAVGNPKARGLLPLAAPTMAAAAMWACIWTVRWQFSGALSVGVLLVVELLAGATSYIAALHVFAPTIARDARTLTLDLLRPNRMADRG